MRGRRVWAGKGVTMKWEDGKRTDVLLEPESNQRKYSITNLENTFHN